MNKNYTNIGVQLLPIILVAASVFYYALGSKVLSVCCNLLAIAMWAALFGVDANNGDDE